MVHNKMIIGSGLIASSLRAIRGAIQYAAGVSNSSCTDTEEFARDAERLREGLLKPGLFIYFSSCAVVDPRTPYLQHKLAMEEKVKERGNYLICRLSNPAGRSPNPHILLNYLYSRIARSEPFDLWTKARRNVIDVRDVGIIVEWLVNEIGIDNETVNIAAPGDHSIEEIVSVFEEITHKKARPKRIDAGDSYLIDVTGIADSPVNFGHDYLARTLHRYYA